MKNYFPYVISVFSFTFFAVALRYVFDIPFFLATGFTILLLIHELGHVFALWRMKKKIKGLYFLPLLGAFVTSGEKFNSRNELAYFKFSGPLIGTVGVLILLAGYFIFKNPDLLTLVFAGTILNLVNMTPLTLLDGHGVLIGINKHVKYAGLFILVVSGFFVFQEYMFSSFLLLIFILFNEDTDEKAAGFKIHEVVVAGACIIFMAFWTFMGSGYFASDLAFLVFSIAAFSLYIKQTCFDKKDETSQMIQAPLTKKEKWTWGVQWASLTIVLAVIILYTQMIIPLNFNL